MRLLLVVFLALCAVCGPAFSAGVSGAGTVPGPYSVGLRVRTFEDRSRMFGPSKDYFGKSVARTPYRQIETLVWYPASRNHSSAIRYGDYWKITKPKDTPGSPIAGPSSLETLTIAHLNALEQPGRFPLIVYAPGADDPAFDNSTMCELLASDGFVVAASPSFGPFRQVMDITVDGLETQIADLNFVLSSMSNSRNVDSHRVGVMGFSWGGLADIVAAMRDPLIGAVLSIDGSVNAFYPLAKSVRDFDPDAMRAPFMLLSSGDDSREDDFFYNDLRFTTASHVRFPTMEHTDMSTTGYLEALAHPAASKPGSLQAYDIYYAQSRDFFGRTLGNGSHNVNGPDVSEHIAMFKNKAPSFVPPTFAQFLQIIERYGTDQARDVFQITRARVPGYRIFDEDSMESLGFEYFNEQHQQDKGIGVLRLVVQGYPDSSTAHGYLARLYQKAGNSKDALVEYDEALRIAIAAPKPDSDWIARLRKRIEDIKPAAP